MVVLTCASIVAAGGDATALTENEVRERLGYLLSVKEPALWKCDDNAQAVSVDRRLEVRGVGDVVVALNRRFKAEKSPEVRVLRIERDTVVVTVSDPQQLTQRMGTAGAGGYLAEVTFSLTSIDGIDYVWLEVPEGDHAGPGRYGRANFFYLVPLEPNEKTR